MRVLFATSLLALASCGPCDPAPPPADAGLVPDDDDDVVVAPTIRGDVRLVAGATITGTQDGASGDEALFFGPAALAPSADGATVYVADTFAGLVREVALADGATTTIGGRPLEAGARDGDADEALFLEPRGMAASLDGATLWVGDGPSLRALDLATGAVQTRVGDPLAQGFVDGDAADARFSFLLHDVEADDDALYVADRGNDAIRKVDLTTSAVTTLVDGLSGPGGLARDGATLYVADTFAGRVVAVDVADGTLTVVASGLDAPQGVALVGDALYATSFASVVERVDLATGAVTVVAGDADDGRALDGDAATARLTGAFAPPVADGVDGVLFLDLESNAVRRVALGDGAIATIAGPSSPLSHRDGADPRFEKLFDVKVGADALVVPDAENHVVRMVDFDGAATTLAGAPGEDDGVDGVGAAARFSFPTGAVVDDDRGAVYVADSGNHAIRRVALADGATTTLAGALGAAGAADGVGAAARFRDPWHLELDAAAGVLYVADAGNGAVRAIVVADGTTTTLVDDLQIPVGLALDVAAGLLYVADFGGHAVHAVDVATGERTLYAGADGEAGRADGALDRARFASPSGAAIDVARGLLYVADTGNDRVVRIDVAAGTAATLFGISGAPANIGPGPARPLEDSPLLAPESVAVRGDVVYVVTEAAVLVATPAAP